MRNVDTSAYSATKPSRIRPDDIDLGDLPPIEMPVQTAKPELSPSVPVVEAPQTPMEQPITPVGSAVFPKSSALAPMPESQNARNLASQKTTILA